MGAFETAFGGEIHDRASIVVILAPLGGEVDGAHRRAKLC